MRSPPGTLSMFHSAHRKESHMIRPVHPILCGEFIEAHDTEDLIAELLGHSGLPNLVGDPKPDRVEPPATLTQLTSRHSSRPLRHADLEWIFNKLPLFLHDSPHFSVDLIIAPVRMQHLDQRARGGRLRTGKQFD